MNMIAGAYTSLKQAAQIAQGLLSLKTDAAVSAKAVELGRVIADVQQQLFSAQADHAALTGRIRDLEAEIARLKDWTQQKQRYELHELAPGSFTYRVKPSMQGSDPPHDLCPRCYEDNVKSILQYGGIDHQHKVYLCPKCRASFMGERIENYAYTVPVEHPFRDYWPSPRHFTHTVSPVHPRTAPESRQTPAHAAASARG